MSKSESKLSEKLRIEIKRLVFYETFGSRKKKKELQKQTNEPKNPWFLFLFLFLFFF